MPLRNTTAIVVVLLLAVVGCGGPTSSSRPASDVDRLADMAHWQESMRRAQQRLAEAPQDHQALYQVARLYALADSTELALQTCERLLAVQPDDHPTLSLWSKLQFDRGQHDAAIARIEACRARQSDLPEALRTGLALHYDAVGRWEESAREFESVRTPNSAKVYHVLRGDDFLQAGDLARAALEAEPGSAASHNNFGITRLYAGDPEAARGAFLRALELEPQLSGALYNLAIVDAFYFFDESKGREWFERYRATGAREDPDGLTELLAVGAGNPLGEQARR